MDNIDVTIHNTGHKEWSNGINHYIDCYTFEFKCLYELIFMNTFHMQHTEHLVISYNVKKLITLRKKARREYITHLEYTIRRFELFCVVNDLTARIKVLNKTNNSEVNVDVSPDAKIIDIINTAVGVDL